MREVCSILLRGCDESIIVEWALDLERLLDFLLALNTGFKVRCIGTSDFHSSLLCGL
jgi:hypothetical protein